MQQHGGADPDSRAVDRSNQRLCRVTDRLEKLIYRAVGAAWRHIDKVGDIVATGEAVLVTLDDHRPQTVIRLGGVDRFGHGAVHVTSQRVFLVRPMHAQGQYGVTSINQQVFGHVVLLNGRATRSVMPGG